MTTAEQLRAIHLDNPAARLAAAEAYCDLWPRYVAILRRITQLEEALDKRGHGHDEEGRCNRCGAKVFPEEVVPLAEVGKCSDKLQEVAQERDELAALLSRLLAAVYPTHTYWADHHTELVEDLKKAGFQLPPGW